MAQRQSRVIATPAKTDNDKYAFRDGSLKTTGTAIDRIMPPVSRFGGGGRTAKKQSIIEKLLNFLKNTSGLYKYDLQILKGQQIFY